MKRIILLIALVSLLVLSLSLTLSAESTQIPQGSQMYAPLTFNMRIERTVPASSGLIPDTVISEFRTPSVRSSIANSTQYFSEYYFLSEERPDNYGRLTYFIRDEYVWDYDPFTLVYSLDPVYLDINAIKSEGDTDWVKFLPVFYLSTFGVNSRIVVDAMITSIDPSGTARDSVNVSNVYNGISTVEQHTFALWHFLPEFEEGDKLVINEFRITCENYSPNYNDRYVTGFLTDTYTELIDANNAPTRVELSSVPLVSILWNSIVDVFEIDLIPGLSLGTILLAIVGLPLLVWFLKLVAGG